MRFHVISLTAAILFLPTAAQAVTSLAVPFTSQAPEGRWLEPWYNACEETVTVMVDRFYSNSGPFSIDEAKRDILQLFDVKDRYIGASFDEPAAVIAQWINHFYPWEARVVSQPSLEQLKAEIDAGRPVIVPTYAPYLRNPFFTGSFEYHTVVLSGYDDERREFITQEPGTRHGENLRYSYGTILSAMHDFRAGDTRHAPQVAVFTSPIVSDSRVTDGDRDGLTKADELRYGTSLFKQDTDGDGFMDGIEVSAGYSPTADERQITSGSLVRSLSRPEVYYIQEGQRRHVASEFVFNINRWNWSQIIMVSDRFLRSLQPGSPIQGKLL